MDGLRSLSGVTLWTHSDPTRSAAVVSFQPGSLDVPRLATALYQRDRIVCATRGGQDRPGIRLSPHLYNLTSEVTRVVEAIGRYLASGL
jgi:selenocysteine lyase/cysteine desulfurase